MDNALKNYDTACTEIAEAFVNKYYNNTTSYDWIDFGGVIEVCDYFWNLDKMVDYLRMNADKDKLFEFYEYQLDCGLKGETASNFKNYLLYNKSS